MTKETKKPKVFSEEGYKNYPHHLDNPEDNPELRKEESSSRKKKQQEKEMWLKIIFIPLVVGISLVATPINMVLFKVIGWVLMIFGIFAGLAYLFKLYGIHKEKIQKIKEDVLSGVGVKKK